jgi:hypothetical protein
MGQKERNKKELGQGETGKKKKEKEMGHLLAC